MYLTNSQLEICIFTHISPISCNCPCVSNWINITRGYSQSYYKDGTQNCSWLMRGKTTTCQGSIPSFSPIYRSSGTCELWMVALDCAIRPKMAPHPAPPPDTRWTPFGQLPAEEAITTSCKRSCMNTALRAARSVFIIQLDIYYAWLSSVIL